MLTVATLADLFGDEVLDGCGPMRSSGVPIGSKPRGEISIHAEVAVPPFAGCASPACARADARLGSRS